MSLLMVRPSVCPPRHQKGHYYSTLLAGTRPGYSATTPRRTALAGGYDASAICSAFARVRGLVILVSTGHFARVPGPKLSGTRWGGVVPTVPTRVNQRGRSILPKRIAARTLTPQASTNGLPRPLPVRKPTFQNRSLNNLPGWVVRNWPTQANGKAVGKWIPAFSVLFFLAAYLDNGIDDPTIRELSACLPHLGTVRIYAWWTS